jgi:hypothetical protein
VAKHGGSVGQVTKKAASLKFSKANTTQPSTGTGAERASKMSGRKQSKKYDAKQAKKKDRKTSNKPTNAARPFGHNSKVEKQESQKGKLSKTGTKDKNSQKKQGQKKAYLSTADLPVVHSHRQSPQKKDKKAETSRRTAKEVAAAAAARIGAAAATVKTSSKNKVQKMIVAVVDPNMKSASAPSDSGKSKKRRGVNSPGKAVGRRSIPKPGKPSYKKEPAGASVGARQTKHKSKDSGMASPAKKTKVGSKKATFKSPRIRGKDVGAIERKGLLIF